MKMTFRWYGRESDPIPLKYVKQIPGMSGLMGLLDKPAGVDWPEEEVKALVEEVHAAGLELEVVESVNPPWNFQWEVRQNPHCLHQWHSWHPGRIPHGMH